MPDNKKILIVGETWTTYSVHTKGFDSFTTSSYGEGYSYLKKTLEDRGFEVDVITNEVAPRDFPDTAEQLGKYATIILSDIGANTLLLTPKTWRNAEVAPNKLLAIKDYVAAGGGLIMVGGYLTFTGVDAKGFWKDTPVADCLPVTMMATDDRREHPEGIRASIVDRGHSVLGGVEGEWPALLGYNRVFLKDDATLIATVGDDPLLALAEFGKGRTAVFTSDCSPHWCPKDFIEWPGYGAIWGNLCTWTSNI